jgi:KDO2-lipid IV(A) lauroyltransferase
MPEDDYLPTKMSSQTEPIATRISPRASNERAATPKLSERLRDARVTDAQPTPLWHPRYWPVHVGLALLRFIVTVLPFAALIRLGVWMGWLAYVFAPRRRHVAKVNIQLCFPALSASARAQRVRRHFEALGTQLLEMGLSWWGNRDHLERLLHLEGREHLERAHAQGRGVLLLSCHMTYHELAGCLLSPHVPVFPMAIYKPFKNPVVDRAAIRGRARYTRLVHRRHPLAALRYLKQGGVVWYAPDQSEGKGGVLVPFFGEPKVMNTGTARIAKSTGALVMPVQQVRLPGSAGYRVIVGPPLEGFPTGDDVADATRLIRVIEEQVELAPDHYSWAHTRFRKRLGLLPSPYDH